MVVPKQLAVAAVASTITVWGGGWGGETSSTNPNGAFLTTGLHWTDGVFLMMGGWLEEVSEATVTSGREGGCCC